VSGSAKVLGLVGAASLAMAIASGADARNLNGTGSGSTVKPAIKSTGTTLRLRQRSATGSKWGNKGIPADPCRTTGKCQPRAAGSWRQ
jgi:hypothetical protein